MIEGNEEDLIEHMLNNFKDKSMDNIYAMEKHFLQQFEEQLAENTKLRIENAILKNYKEMYLSIVDAIQGVGKDEEE